MNNVLLDTSIIIDHIRSKEKDRSNFSKFAKQNISLFVSIITHTELYAGKSVWERPKALQELELIFADLNIIPLTTSISIQAGQLRALNSLATIDAIIAATAIIENLPLVTLNPKDFRPVKGLKLL